MEQIRFFYPFKLLFVAFFLLSNLAVQAQVREPLKPQTTRSAQAKPTVVAPFEAIGRKSAYDKIVDEATYLRLNTATLKSALKDQPRDLVLEIPTAGGGTMQLLLSRQQILTPDFKVVDGNGKELPYQPGQYFTGKVLDRTESEQGAMAALSIVGDEVMGMMTIGHENYVLGALTDGAGRKTTEYVLYSDADLAIANTYACGTTMEEHHLENPGTSSHTPAGNKTVKVQLEADHQMFLDFGSSTANVANYVTGLFNMVATIYQNENIATQIQTVVVWNIPDPYPLSAGNSSGDVLNAYYNRKNLVGISGDLAHLLSTKPLGHGGIAWVDVLCHPTTGYHTAYSNISTSYNNFPLYSWTIDVVTHEMGHNLGSPHTHDCVWGAGANQALDNCYTPSGGCAPGPAPTNGGTIMSYCHITAAGKNFNLGFGSQPGNLIRSKVAAAGCLGAANLNCAGATPIFCGEPVSGSTIGGVNTVNVYGCNSWVQWGPERVFMLQTTEPGTITATLSNLSADLDVIILDACSESNCLAEGNNSAVVPNAPAGQYFIVVDGYNGAQGNFTLSVNCQGPCFANGITSFEFIDRVQVGTIDNQSGNDYGYADYTGISTPIQRGGSASVSLTPGFISSTWGERWRIWIDINKDDDFNDYGELVFDGGAASNTTVNGTLNVPSWAQLGTTRMRVAMRFNSAPNDCGTFSGEVEDYTVDIVPFCPSLGNTKYEYIQAVEVGDFGNLSGNNFGYADFTSMGAIELLKETDIPVALSPGFPGFNYGENWNVFIDLDQDFNFEASELVFSTLGASNTTVEGTFNLASTALNGLTRMRITMFYGGDPSSCSYSFFGETEDYLVNIAPFCATSANSSYEFIKSVGISDLLNDSGNDGGYADFTSLAANVEAGVPAGIVLVPGFEYGEYKEYWRVWVDFNLNKRFEAEELVFEAGPSSDLVFGAITLPADLAEGKYGLRVAMRFGDFPEPCGNIGWGEVEDYTLSVTPGGEFGEIGDRSNGGSRALDFASGKNQLTLFPNPASATLNLDFGGLQPVAGQVVSTTGNTMLSFDGNNVPDKLDVSNYPAGVYMLQIVTEENTVVTERFVKVD